MVDRYKSSIKHWPEGERPRERLIKFGSDKLSDAQLLESLSARATVAQRKMLSTSEP